MKSVAEAEKACVSDRVWVDRFMRIFESAREILEILFVARVINEL